MFLQRGMMSERDEEVTARRGFFFFSKCKLVQFLPLIYKSLTVVCYCDSWVLVEVIEEEYFVSIKLSEDSLVSQRQADHQQPATNLWKPPRRFKSLHLDAKVRNLQLHRRPRSAPSASSWGRSVTAFSPSVEVCLACRASSLALVSHGGALADSWGIWRPRELRCRVCRSPCRWPSSRTGLRPFPPQWR